jgi:hypothetical protein
MMTFGVADCSLDELPFKIIEIRAKRGFERFRTVYRSGGQYLHVPVCSWNICGKLLVSFVFSHKVSTLRPLASLFDPLPCKQSTRMADVQYTAFLSSRGSARKKDDCSS